jgi:hypothetical protein
MNNPETQSTLDTQDTEQINVRENRRASKNGQSRDKGNIGHKVQNKDKQNKKHNLENYKVKVRETERDKQEWTIQRHRQH